jgi:hypothetical protein
MTSPLLNRIFKYTHDFLADKNASKATLMQTALWIAMLSVIFERADALIFYFTRGEYYLTSVIFLMIVVLFTFLYRPLRHASICVFSLGLVLLTIDDWALQANHSWLAFWLITPLVLFPNWWEGISYISYTRITLGVVMLTAGVQKIVTHTYLDGSYITYLSYYGSISEQLFRFVCDSTVLTEPCIGHISIGVFIVFWQILVGLLLVFGIMGFWVLMIEVSFLLGAGFYADEMNFQTLNIAMLTIALGYGMKHWLAVACIGLLIIDIIGVGDIIEYCLLLSGIW